MPCCPWIAFHTWKLRGYFWGNEFIIYLLIYFWIYKCCSEGRECGVTSSDSNILLSVSGPIVVETLTTSLRLITVILLCYLLLIDTHSSPFIISLFWNQIRHECTCKNYMKISIATFSWSDLLMRLDESLPSSVGIQEKKYRMKIRPKNLV